MLNKLGLFLLVVGGTFLVLFVLSITAKSPEYNLLVLGGLIFLFGSFLHWISPRQPSPPSDRFHSFKKLRARPGQKNKKS
jgi:predicted membrane channel-forming protein YqfA (hemolysin III family)